MKNLQPIYRCILDVVFRIQHEKRFCARMRKSEYFEIEKREEYTLSGEEGVLLTGRFRNTKNNLEIPCRVFLVSWYARCESEGESCIKVNKNGEVQAYEPQFGKISTFS